MSAYCHPVASCGDSMACTAAMSCRLRGLVPKRHYNVHLVVPNRAPPQPFRHRVDLRSLATPTRQQSIQLWTTMGRDIPLLKENTFLCLPLWMVYVSKETHTVRIIPWYIRQLYSGIIPEHPGPYHSMNHSAATDLPFTGHTRHVSFRVLYKAAVPPSFQASIAYGITH